MAGVSAVIPDACIVSYKAFAAKLWVVGDESQFAPGNGRRGTRMPAGRGRSPGPPPLRRPTQAGGAPPVRPGENLNLMAGALKFVGKTQGEQRRQSLATCRGNGGSQWVLVWNEKKESSRFVRICRRNSVQGSCRGCRGSREDGRMPQAPRSRRQRDRRL